MSKRFGRNQKRAMRDQLALEKGSLKVMAKKLGDREDQLHDQRLELHELQQAVVMTREVLGEFFATLPAMNMAVEVGVDCIRIPVHGSSARFFGYSSAIAAELSSQVGRIEQLEALGHEWFDDLRGQMVLRFRNGAGDMSYGFSVNSFRGWTRGRVAKIIADSMYRYMVENPAVLDRLGVKS